MRAEAAPGPHGRLALTCPDQPRPASPCQITRSHLVAAWLTRGRASTGACSTRFKWGHYPVRSSGWGRQDPRAEWSPASTAQIAVEYSLEVEDNLAAMRASGGRIARTSSRDRVPAHRPLEMHHIVRMGSDGLPSGSSA